MHVLSTTKLHSVNTNYFTGKHAKQRTRRMAKVSLFRLMLPLPPPPPPLLLVLITGFYAKYFNKCRSLIFISVLFSISGAH
jgi:hypothetical protein